MSENNQQNMTENDRQFFNRADAFINTANTQLEQGNDAGQVSASMMYGLARFSAWFSASGWQSSEDMAKAKAETLDFFVNEYRKMLELNLDDYIAHFDKYITATRQAQDPSQD